MRQDNAQNTPEEAVEEPQATAAPEQPAEPKSELEQLREQFDQLQDQHLRLMAEYDNYRKRTAKEKEESYANATVAVLNRFLPIEDSLERAMSFEHNGDEFAKGIEMITANFAQALESFGVTSFGEPGDPFDPALHHAVMHLEDEAFGENVVAMVLQKGYKMGDRVLRYAMVQTAN